MNKILNHDRKLTERITFTSKNQLMRKIVTQKSRHDNKLGNAMNYGISRLGPDLV